MHEMIREWHNDNILSKLTSTKYMNRLLFYELETNIYFLWKLYQKCKYWLPASEFCDETVNYNQKNKKRRIEHWSY